MRRMLHKSMQSFFYHILLTVTSSHNIHLTLLFNFAHFNAICIASSKFKIMKTLTLFLIRNLRHPPHQVGMALNLYPNLQSIHQNGLYGTFSFN